MADIDEEIESPDGDEEDVDLEQDGDDLDEDDDGDEVDDGEGEEPQAEDPAHVAARLQEKERQAAGLTTALRQERAASQHLARRAQALESKLYHVLDMAIANAHRGEQPDGDSEPEVDILDQVEERVKKQVGPLAERLDKQDQAAQTARLEQTVEQVHSWVQEDRNNGVTHLPGYEQAEAIVGRRILGDIIGEVQARRPDLDPDTLQQFAQQLFGQRIAQMQLAHAEQGRSFAQSLYNWAQQLGFAPEASPGLERVRRGVSGSRGPSAAPAARRPMPKDARQLMDLSDDEFSDALESLGEKGFKSILASMEVPG